MLDDGAVASLCLETRTDVLDQHQEHADPAAATPHRAQVEPCRHQAAIGAQEAAVTLEALAAAGQHLVEQRLLGFEVIHAADAGPTGFQQLLATQAENAAQLEVDLRPAEGRGDQRHADQRRLEEKTQAVVALAQLLLGTAPGGDVLGGAVYTYQLAAVALGNSEQPHPAGAAPGGGGAHLDIELIFALVHLLQGAADQLAAGSIELAQ